ncbi:MAG: ADP-glyceromanno-heptose 6-epimerase [Cyclobacteriaceae bacterium]|nr:ADP-glyceromanno-heptose 6-epimerase [Cyclobacteriaceae bacterium]
MIIVTGAAGFIGSQLIKKLNENNFNNIIAVDQFDSAEKNENLKLLTIKEKIPREQFFNWIDSQDPKELEFIFHIGARTDTTEFDIDILRELNTEYSKKVWIRCVGYQIPLVYASSAATYGKGEMGYEDDERLIQELKPLNPYGESKNEFDKWVLEQAEKPFFWAGLKFFNVYGPHEDHKGRMASVIWHAFFQVLETGGMKLFRSHHPGYGDGEQKRDFIFVKDVVNVCYYLMHNRRHSGIYNLGTGQARTFLDLTKAVFKAMNKPEKISFIDTPADIRDKYQYFTQAEMNKLRSIGYTELFTSLEEGVRIYVQEYLIPKYN